jgi:hypothetical protein
MLRFWRQQPIGAAHDLPVVSIGGPAEQTDLIVLAAAVDARPGESMGAKSREESPQEFHLCRFRARGSSLRWRAKRFCLRGVQTSNYGRACTLKVLVRWLTRFRRSGALRTDGGRTPLAS